MALPAERAKFIVFFHDEHKTHIDTMDTQYGYTMDTQWSSQDLYATFVLSAKIGLHVILVTVGGIFAVDLTKSDFMKHQHIILSL
jgi:hypothetical protein